LPGEELVVLFEFRPVFVSFMLGLESTGFSFKWIVICLGELQSFHFRLFHLGLVFEICRFGRSLIYNSYFLFFVEFLVVESIYFVERVLTSLFELVSGGW